MGRKRLVLAAIATLLVVMPFSKSFAVEPASASPIPILAYLAEDSDGSVTGYLITESASRPGANDPNWSVTPPAEYSTSSFGSVTLFAWAKDDKGAVSDSMTDSTDVPAPPINADTLDGLDSTDIALASHNHDAVYQRHFSNVITVSLDGNGDYVSPVDAMSSITNASAANPYLIKIMSGIYDIGGATLTIKDGVTLQDSGSEATEIQGMATADDTRGVVAAIGGNTTVRDLSITSNGNKGVFPSSLALYYFAGGTHRVENVKLFASPGFAEAHGLHLHSDSTVIGSNIEVLIDGVPGGGTSVQEGVLLSSGTASLKNVRITNLLGGYGLLASGNVSLENISVNAPAATGMALVSAGPFRLKNIDIESGLYGLRVVGVGATAHVDLYDSTLVSDNFSIRLEDGATMNASNTRIDSGVDNPGGGVLKLVNCFDGNFDPVLNQ